MNDRPVSAFAQFEKKAWPYRFRAGLVLDRIAGGIPTNPKVAEGWIRAKLGEQTEQAVQAQVVETMLDRGVSEAEAAKLVADTRSLNGFKRLPCPECPPEGPTKCARPGHVLYIEGRQVKSAIKEAANVAAAVGKLPQKPWGVTKKWINAFVAEHIFVEDVKIPLGVDQPTGVDQRFVQSMHGSSIAYTEYVENAEIEFTVASDHEFTEEQWAMLWLTGGKQGLGATRSQGYGTYTVTKWSKLS